MAEDNTPRRDDAPPVSEKDSEPAESEKDARDAPPASEKDGEDAPSKTMKTSWKTVVAMIVVAVLGVGMILYAWNIFPFSSPVIRTENSYVRGQVTLLAPQVDGYVASVEVKDFETVKAGQALVRIDDRIYQQQLDRAQGELDIAIANLDNVQQTLAQNEADIGSREADLLQAEAELYRARADLQRSGILAGKGIVPEVELEQVTASEKAAVASVMRAQAAINVAKETKQSTIVSQRVLAGEVTTAQADKDLAAIDLANTVILAPRDGQLSEASVRPGQYVSAGSQLMSLVPDDVWVVANFKETQTTNLRTGQPASVSVDALGGAVLHGTVDEISPATGSEFSVLRADNASGNFTKVVQRIPIRIRLDSDQELIDRIRPGMSVETSIDTSR